VSRQLVPGHGSMTWNAVLTALDGLISSRATKAGPKSVHAFQNMYVYLEVCFALNES
jgi:hypothetical protein